MISIATVRVAVLGQMGVWHRGDKSVLFSLLTLLILLCRLLIVIEVPIGVAMRVIPVVCLSKIWVRCCNVTLSIISVSTVVINFVSNDGSLMDDGSFMSFNIVVVDGLMDGDTLHLSRHGGGHSYLRGIKVSSVVAEGWADINRVCVVVCTLQRNVVILRPCHSEVKWVVSLILVVIGVILVAMGVLTGHVVVFWVHVVL